MSYIGNTPTQQNFVAGADQFNGNGSTTAFTLSRNVNTVFDIFVAISNVPQDPYNAYSVSGNTLTFTSAPPSGTGNIYVVYRATNVQTFVPSPGVSPSFGNLTYTGTLTGSTGVVNIGSGQLYKDASGNVGIGTSSPSGRLHVASSAGSLPLYVTSSASAQNVRIRLNSSDTASSVAYVWSYSDASLNKQASIYLTSTGGLATQVGQTAGAEPTSGTLATFIDSSGNVGIGSTSITRAYANYNQLNLNGTSGATIQMQAGGTSYANFVADSNALYVQGQTAIAFGVGGSGTGTERARIDSSGNFMVGTASPTAKFTVNESLNGPASDFYTSGGAVGTPCMYVKKQPNNATTSQVYIQFLFNNGSSGNGQINGNGSGAAAFGTYSDARLKENIVDLPPQLENICALRPVEFNYIESEGGGHQTGFIAQEMQQVYPDAVGMREPDEMLTVTGWSKTEARLVKAIQELNAKVEAQAAEIAALKGAA